MSNIQGKEGDGRLCGRNAFLFCSAQRRGAIGRAHGRQRGRGRERERGPGDRQTIPAPLRPCGRNAFVFCSAPRRGAMGRAYGGRPPGRHRERGRERERERGPGDRQTIPAPPRLCGRHAFLFCSAPRRGAIGRAHGRQRGRGREGTDRDRQTNPPRLCAPAGDMPFFCSRAAVRRAFARIRPTHTAFLEGGRPRPPKKTG